MAAAVFFVRDFTRLAWLTIAIGLAGYGLIEQAWRLSDGPSRYPEKLLSGTIRVTKAEIQAVLKNAPGLDQNDPRAAGWVEDVFPTIVQVSPPFDSTPIPRYSPCWHTYLTGIMKHDGVQRVGIWYPGGPIEHAADCLDVRERGN